VSASFARAEVGFAPTRLGDKPRHRVGRGFAFRRTEFAHTETQRRKGRRRSLGLASRRPARRRLPAQGVATLRGLDPTFLQDRCWSDGRSRLAGSGAGLNTADAPANCFVSLWLRVRIFRSVTAEGPGSVRSGAGSSRPKRLPAADDTEVIPPPRLVATRRLSRSFLSQSHEDAKVGDGALAWLPGGERAVRLPAQGLATLRGLDLRSSSRPLLERWPIRRRPERGRCSSNMLRAFVALCENIPIRNSGGTRLRPVRGGKLPPDAASGRGRHGGHPSAAAFCNRDSSQTWLSPTRLGTSRAT
jgi:hypothetical protein